jgi:hypothetical protein
MSPDATWRPPIPGFRANREVACRRDGFKPKKALEKLEAAKDSKATEEALLELEKAAKYLREILNRIKPKAPKEKAKPKDGAK